MSGHGVDPVTDPVEFLLGVDGEVGALADVAPQQPVEVLVGRPHPRAVGLSEEHVDACPFSYSTGGKLRCQCPGFHAQARSSAVDCD